MTEGKKLAQIQEGAKKKTKSRKYFTVFLVTVIVLTFLVLAFLNFFNINSLKINGISENVPYTAEDMAEFLNIGDKTNLITYDTKKAKRALLYHFPYIENLTIKKRFPSTLEINVTENKGTLYLELGEDVFILSSTGRVLETTTDPFYDGHGRTQLIVSGVKRCVCGEDVVFSGKDTMSILQGVTSQLDKYSVIDNVTRLDITDRFEIVMMYEDRFEIKLGTFENMENKINLLANMMDGRIQKERSGVIDISDGDEAVVKYSTNVTN